MPWKVDRVHGLEVLDSRGRPTVKAYCELTNGFRGSASVPSGASRGGAEACELRDGDPNRHGGQGCLRAAANLSEEVSRFLSGRRFASQLEFDHALIELDGTPDKSRLGANALLAASVAFARAASASEGHELFNHLADMVGGKVDHLPRPTINLFSGGLHAGKQTAIQDVLIVPMKADSISRCLEQACAVYRAAVQLVQDRYGMRWLTADEGGLAPPVQKPEELLDLAMTSVENAGMEPGEEFRLAVDVASSHFHEGGLYFLEGEGVTGDDLIKRLLAWAGRYPIISMEDGLAEEDWEAWTRLMEAVGEMVLVLGDDLLCTNAERIQKAIRLNACNALLLKVNQVGTLSEAMDSFRTARNAGWTITASVRSGETEDDWFSDLAVGWAADMTKIGSLTQSERLSKYNRLLEIEDRFGLSLQ